MLDVRDLQKVVGAAVAHKGKSEYPTEWENEYKKLLERVTNLKDLFRLMIWVPPVGTEAFGLSIAKLTELRTLQGK